MKCPECDGTGKVQKWFYERTGFGKCEKVCGDVKCEWCNGTGEMEQTEQEYIQTCNTEQLAKVLNTIFLAKKFCQVCSDDCGVGQECKYDCCGKQDDFITWLKQPHTDKE